MADDEVRSNWGIAPFETELGSLPYYRLFPLSDNTRNAVSKAIVQHEIHRKPVSPRSAKSCWEVNQPQHGAESRIRTSELGFQQVSKVDFQVKVLLPFSVQRLGRRVGQYKECAPALGLE